MQKRKLITRVLDGIIYVCSWCAKEIESKGKSLEDRPEIKKYLKQGYRIERGSMCRFHFHQNPDEFWKDVDKRDAKKPPKTPLIIFLLILGIAAIHFL